MKRSIQSIARRNFNRSSSGGISHITDDIKDVFMAMTAGEPNFCLTSVYVNGKPGAAIVYVVRENDIITVAPCFVSIAEGMKLRMMDGQEYG